MNESLNSRACSGRQIPQVINGRGAGVVSAEQLLLDTVDLLPVAVANADDFGAQGADLPVILDDGYLDGIGQWRHRETQGLPAVNSW